MKKILYFLCAAVLAFGLASCAKNVTSPNESATLDATGQMSIVAGIADEQATKTSLSGNDTEGYQVLWSDGDQIHILVKRDIQEVFTYTLKEGAGTRFGVFTGPVLPDGEYTAGYGDNFGVENGGHLTSEQSYSTSGSACCAPMMASVAVVGGIAKVSDFRNISGLLRLDLTGNGTVKQIKVTTDQAQVGLIKLDEEGAARISSYPSGKYVNLDCGQNGVGLSSTATSFYISMPKGNYTGMKIEVTDLNGNTVIKTQKSDKTLNIARAQITPLSLAVMLVPTTGVIDGKTWVQLWDNGPKWATENVYDGDGNEYFESFDPWDEDTATDLWGSNWRTPTTEEIISLCAFCNRSEDRSAGTTIVTGKGLYSGNSITLTDGRYWLIGGVYYEVRDFMEVESGWISVSTTDPKHLEPSMIRAVVKE